MQGTERGKMKGSADGSGILDRKSRAAGTTRQMYEKRRRENKYISNGWQ